MTSKLYIPKFQNGVFLTESEFYHHAWLPLELHRLNSLAKVFCPSTNAETSSNHFEQAYDHLTVHTLFVVSPERIPFVLTEAQRIELQFAKKVGRYFVNY
jgi:hypothetical protein